MVVRHSLPLVFRCRALGGADAAGRSRRCRTRPTTASTPSARASERRELPHSEQGPGGGGPTGQRWAEYEYSHPLASVRDMTVAFKGCIA